ncbi:MAG: hypothetical protein AVDCRST_MAG50-134, partial [uncultured Acidimicrobiales bacterium]
APACSRPHHPGHDRLGPADLRGAAAHREAGADPRLAGHLRLPRHRADTGRRLAGASGPAPLDGHPAGLPRRCGVDRRRDLRRRAPDRRRGEPVHPGAAAVRPAGRGGRGKDRPAGRAVQPRRGHRAEPGTPAGGSPKRRSTGAGRHPELRQHRLRHGDDLRPHLPDGARGAQDDGRRPEAGGRPPPHLHPAGGGRLRQGGHGIHGRQPRDQRHRRGVHVHLPDHHRRALRRGARSVGRHGRPHPDGRCDARCDPHRRRRLPHVDPPGHRHPDLLRRLPAAREPPAAADRHVPHGEPQPADGARQRAHRRGGVRHRRGTARHPDRRDGAGGRTERLRRAQGRVQGHPFDRHRPDPGGHPARRRGL